MAMLKQPGGGQGLAQQVGFTYRPSGGTAPTAPTTPTGHWQYAHQTPQAGGDHMVIPPGNPFGAMNPSGDRPAVPSGVFGGSPPGVGHTPYTTPGPGAVTGGNMEHWPSIGDVAMQPDGAGHNPYTSMRPAPAMGGWANAFRRRYAQPMTGNWRLRR